MIGTNRNPEGGVHDIHPPGSRDSSHRVDHEAERPRPGFRILSLTDLLERPAIEWLIENALPKNGIAVLYGPSGIGKTFLAIEMSLSVAMGAPWRGFDVAEGVVLYIVAEGLKGIGKRLRARLGRRLDDRADPIFDRFFVIDEAVNFLDQSAVEALVTAIRGMTVKPVLVVIDTLARCMVGGDENSAQHMGMFIEGCDRLRQVCGAAVLVVHHTTKKGNAERGSSALRGGADTMLEVSKTDEGALKLACDKQKDSDPFEPAYFELEQVEVETAGDGTAITSCIPRWRDAPPARQPEENENKPTPDELITQKLREFGLAGATGPDLRAATGLLKQTFYDHLHGLIERGTVEKIPGSTPVRYGLARQSESESGSPPDSDQGEVNRSESESAAPRRGGGTRTPDQTRTKDGAGLFGDEAEGWEDHG